MENKYHIEYVANNPEHDDLFKIECYEKSSGKLVGYIDIEEIFDGYDYLSDFLDNESYDEIFDGNYEILELKHIHVNSLYRNKGIANFMMNKLFDEVLPDIFPTYEDIILYRSCYDVPNDKRAFYNLHILKPFYESFGFVEIEENQDYMIKKL